MPTTTVAISSYYVKRSRQRCQEAAWTVYQASFLCAAWDVTTADPQVQMDLPFLLSGC